MVAISAQKNGGSKTKIHEQSVLPKKTGLGNGNGGVSGEGGRGFGSGWLAELSWRRYLPFAREVSLEPDTLLVATG